MKRLLFSAILFLLFIPQNNYAQKEAYEMIGKSIGQVIKTFGKPAYHDKSNPEMECVFYRNKSFRMVFVGNKNSIYQAEQCQFYNSKNSAAKEISKIINNCVSGSFQVDTLSVTEYGLTSKQVNIDISLFENTVLKKYEVRMKAYKKE